MTQQINIGLIGAKGRMGTALQDVVTKHQQNYHITCLVDRHTHGPYLSLYDVIHRSITTKTTDVWIDFSLPDNLDITFKWLADHNTKGAYVLGVTNLTETHFTRLKEISRIRPIFYSPNMSLGIAVIKHMLPVMLEFLQHHDALSVEVEESHHHKKVDCPSGTALMFAHTLLKAWGVPRNAWSSCIKTAYHQVLEGDQPTVYCISHRRGQSVGEHAIHLTWGDEEITLQHKMFNRQALALGALNAATWLHQQPAGFYEMHNLLKQLKTS